VYVLAPTSPITRSIQENGHRNREREGAKIGEYGMDVIERCRRLTICLLSPLSLVVEDGFAHSLPSRIGVVVHCVQSPSCLWEWARGVDTSSQLCRTSKGGQFPCSLTWWKSTDVPGTDGACRRHRPYIDSLSLWCPTSNARGTRTTGSFSTWNGSLRWERCRLDSRCCRMW